MKKATRLKTITALLLFTIGVFVLNNTLFSHVHILEDGTLIAHAHPVKKADGEKDSKTHSHSIAQFLQYDHANTEWIIPVVLALLLFFIILNQYSPFLSKHKELQFISIAQSRAPPIQ